MTGVSAVWPLRFFTCGLSKTRVSLISGDTIDPLEYLFNRNETLF